ncbi:helix-turn-helix domain-containing protein [Ruegeria atlantica]|uniref:Helix-turn-helix domain-containing protein n=1 Tax=Ruegeria atlantica TaxID=81569 RepID=A0AA90Z0H4_9RHOB|nr:MULTISPECIES: helix-turn-helix transcriptional regulator [Ruegeria]NOE18394.1 helix-turn-helix domain-containing protein [Ruegeria atlantica]
MPNERKIPTVEFGRELRGARLQLGLTQRELAEMAFQNPDRASSISSYETGKNFPSAATLIDLESALGVRFHFNLRYYKKRDRLGGESGTSAKDIAATATRLSSKPKSTRRVLSSSANQISQAVAILLSETGINRLPEGLDALEVIPLTLLSIAKSANSSDYDVLIDYIAKLERENAELREAVRQNSESSRLDIFLDEATKTLAGWQAWMAITTALFAAVAYLDIPPPNEVLDCLEDSAPPAIEDDWSVTEV